GNPVPSTSSDRIRVTCCRVASGSASPNTSPTTTPSGCRRHTPAAASSPSGTNARWRWPSAAPRWAAGENPSRNRALASSENGPAGTSSKVVMGKLYQGRPTAAALQPEPAAHAAGGPGGGRGGGGRRGGGRAGRGQAGPAAGGAAARPVGGRGEGEAGGDHGQAVVAAGEGDQPVGGGEGM